MIFDRSWYGRVLVERVEGFAPEAEWQRAYEEINDFEPQLVEHGIVLEKFWLHIDREEQLRRFKDAREDPLQEVQDHRRGLSQPRALGRLRERRGRMVAHTSTDIAPWRLVPANDKRFARVAVLDAICGALARRLE